MKKNSYIGYTLSLISGLVVIASAFLSLIMTSSVGVLSQGDSLFNYLINSTGSYDPTFNAALVLYVGAIALALILVICSVIGLIMTSMTKHSKIFLLIQRVVSLLAFVFIIISFILLGLHLLSIEAEYFNFTGLGIVVGILGSLLLVEGIFLVRNPARERKSDD